MAWNLTGDALRSFTSSSALSSLGGYRGTLTALPTTALPVVFFATSTLSPVLARVTLPVPRNLADLILTLTWGQACRLFPLSLLAVIDWKAQV
jgi:hypothetical protein